MKKVLIPFIMISLSILFGYMCLINAKNIYRYNQYSNEYIQLKKHMKEQEKYYVMLSEKALLLNQSTFLEKTIKQKLGYVLPGEQVYYFVKKGYK